MKLLVRPNAVLLNLTAAAELASSVDLLLRKPASVKSHIQDKQTMGQRAVMSLLRTRVFKNLLFAAGFVTTNAFCMRTKEQNVIKG